MKKGCIIFLLSCIISVTALGFTGVFSPAVPPTQSYLRIHIRANSNDTDEQAVKYAVRDVIVDYLTPLVAEYKTQEEAIDGIDKQLPVLEILANGVLQKKGFLYTAKAQIKREVFPTRVYGEYTLPHGEYAALVIELGSGKGDNWWCVAYPPLCFTGTQNVVYKSKIVEIIHAWKGAGMR